MYWINSKIFTVLLSVLTIWILFSVISVEVDKNAVKKEEMALESKVTRINQDSMFLKKYIDNFDNPDFLEKEARFRLNYKAPGEEVVFVHRDLDSQKASSAEKFSGEDLPNYKKWLHYLLGL